MTSLKAVIVDLFGSYVPVTYSDGTIDIIPSGLAGVDFEWLAGVLLFALSLYCVFRILGGILTYVNRR